MKKFLNNENGYSFLMVFFTMVLITILGVGLISVSANSLKTSTNERNDQSVYYIAEAGLATKKSEVENELLVYYKDIKAHYDKLSKKKKLEYDFETEFYKKVDNELNLSPTNLRNFESQFGNSPTANVNIRKISSGISPLEYKIKSVGTIGKKERTVSQIITVKLNEEPPIGSGSKYAVHTRGDIFLSGSAKINGSAATEFGKITFNNDSNKITGDIWTDPENIKLPDYMVNRQDGKEILAKAKGHDGLPQISVPPFPNFQELPYPNDIELEKDGNKFKIINNGSFLATNYIANHYQLNLTSDMRFKDFFVNENKNITINVGNSDKNLYIENINIPQGIIKIIGTGTLNVYVRDGFYIKGHFNKDGKADQINFFYSSSKTSPLIVDQETIISGSFYAPNAKMELLNGARIEGSIIADSLFTSGGINVTYDSGAGGGSTGAKEYPDTINLTENSSVIEED